MSSEESYSVSQLSKMAGVSIRTLHHYDKIGLLPARRRKDNGYREYDQSQLALLLQIIVYRKLGFSLDKIFKIVSSDDYDLFEALANQRNLLLTRQQETLSMINSIEVAMSVLKGKNYLERVFKTFPDDKAERWCEILEKSIGDEESDMGLATLGAALGDTGELEFECDTGWWKKWQTEYSKFVSLSINSREVQEMAKEHYVMLSRFCREIAPETDFRGLDYSSYLAAADSVLSDQPTREIYEHFHTGMAEHLHEAMIFFAENSLKDNEAQFKALC